MTEDTHEAGTARGALQLALLSLPQPDDWIYSYDDEAEGPPVALLLAGDRLVEVTAAWEGSGPASLKAVGRKLVDAGAVIEMEWRGATFDGDVLQHDTSGPSSSRTGRGSKSRASSARCQARMRPSTRGSVSRASWRHGWASA
jgi:hypothetical protein